MPSLYILVMGSKENMKGKGSASKSLSGDYTSIYSESEYSTISYEEESLNQIPTKKTGKKLKSNKTKKDI